MKLTNIIGVGLAVFGIGSGLQAQKYKAMMHNPQYNFYDVVREAEAYFATHPTGKGSGYKPYLRWKEANESKFYPSGDRSQANFSIAVQSAAPFIQQAHQSSRDGSTGWQDLGPYSANSITHGYNPGIGRVETFYINPANSNVMYMGSRSGGFWRTIDGGQNWLNTTDTLVASGVNQIVASPNNPDYVLINVRNGQNATSHGIYVSTNGGMSWSVTHFNPDSLGLGGLGDNFQVYKLAINPLESNAVYIGTNQGVFKADSAVTQWTQLLSGTSITDIEFHPTNDSIVYLYDNYYWGNNKNKIFISHDFGQSYTTSNTINGNNQAKGFISTTPDAPNNVYFASDNGVWKSNDMGQNFTLLSTPTESCDGFAVSDVDSMRMIYGYLELQASQTGGNSFVTVTNWYNTSPDASYTHADLRTAECINGVFYVGTDGYLARSTNNGQSWERLNDGTGIREFYAAGVSQGHYRTFMAGSQDNGTSILDETGWVEWNGGDGMEAIIHPLNPLWMIGSWQYGSRSYTNDGGFSREFCNNPSRDADSADWQAPMFFDPNHPMRVYHFGTKLGISEDFGKTWNYGPNHNLGARPTRAAIAYNNSDIMVGVKNGLVRLTTDGWITKKIINPGLPNLYVTDITFAPSNDSVIAVTYNAYQNDGQKVFITTDMGQSWTNITYNLGDMPIHSVAIDHSPEQNIYVGAELGVFVKPMNGMDWQPLTHGLPSVPARDLDIHFGSNTIKAATWGRGLWEAHLLNRANYPHILTTTITNPPTEIYPKSGYDQWVDAVISSANAIEEVKVIWSADTETYDQTIPMSLLSDSTYLADAPFPHLAEGTKVFFKVIAEDELGQVSETHKFVFTFKKGLPVSVNELAINELNLFPNPNKGKFYVSFGSPLKKAEVQVYNMAGQLISSHMASGNGIELFVNAPKGMYNLVVKHEEGTETLKFTIH